MNIFDLLPFIFPNECLFCGKEKEGSVCKKCQTKIFVRGESKTQLNNKLFYLSIYKNNGEKLIEFLKNRKYFSLIPYLLDESLFLLDNEKIDYITSVPSLKFLAYIPEHLEVFSKDLSKKKNIRYLELITKIKRIKSQVTLTIQERNLNPIGAFSLRRDYKDLIKDKRILIIDDVYTTGSTLKECEKLIENNGGEVLSLVYSKAIIY